MPHASAMRTRPRLVALAIRTASRLRLSSGVLTCLPPAWVKHSRNPVRRSNSISRETIGAKGSSSVSSAFSTSASAGMSSADSGRNDQLPVFAQAHRPDAHDQYSLEVGQRGAQLGVGLVQLSPGVSGLADQLAELKPQAW